MKKWVILLGILSVCVMPQAGLSQDKAGDKKAAAAPNPAVDELKQLENDWMVAAKAKDADKLGELLADGWTSIGWDGKTKSKAQALADLKKPDSSLESYEMGPMKVRVFGSTAVVTGSDTEKSVEKGKDSSGTYLWTDVFVKQNGKWKVVSSQTTKAQK